MAVSPKTGELLRWLLLIAATVAVAVPLALLGVPAAALLAALVVGVALALMSAAPNGVPRRAGMAAEGVLGVYIGTMVQSDTLGALGSAWPVVLAAVLAILVCSVLAGAVLGHSRDLGLLTGVLSMGAGGPSGMTAIAGELGADAGVVATVQYLRLVLISAYLPVVVLFAFGARTSADHSRTATLSSQGDSAPWYLSAAILVVVVTVGAGAGRLIRLPGAGLLGPLGLTIALELSGSSFGLTVPVLLVWAGYLLIGWQAGVAFTRESMRSIGHVLPAALGLIVALNLAAAGLGVLLAHLGGVSVLEGYLATNPGGVYAVLATAAETGSDVTFIVAAQVMRILLMLIAAALLARGLARRARLAHPAAVGDTATTAEQQDC